MVISPLQNHLHFADEVAYLHHQEWKHFSTNETIESRRASLITAAAQSGINETGTKEASAKEVIPAVYIVHEGDEFIGSAALVEKDMDTHPDIGPWLAAVFVKETWRQQGVATLLLDHCECQSKNAGIEHLYLSTQFASKLYAKNGWVTLEKCRYKGVDVDLMRKNLRTTQA